MCKLLEALALTTNRENCRLTVPSLEVEIVVPSIEHSGRPMQLGTTPWTELILWGGENLWKEAAIDTCDDR
jgi:hypothetical protein